MLDGLIGYRRKARSSYCVICLALRVVMLLAMSFGMWADAFLLFVVSVSICLWLKLYADL